MEEIFFAIVYYVFMHVFPYTLMSHNIKIPYFFTLFLLLKWWFIVCKVPWYFPFTQMLSTPYGCRYDNAKHTVLRK